MATYTVRAGDSLSKIARDVLGDMDLWPDLAQLNRIGAPYTIYVGQVLQLPAAAPSNTIRVTTTSATPPPAMPAASWLTPQRLLIGAGAILAILGLL